MSVVAGGAGDFRVWTNLRRADMDDAELRRRERDPRAVLGNI
jgi:hypothetical protein